MRRRLLWKHTDRHRFTARRAACTVYPNPIGNPRCPVIVCIHHCHDIVNAGQDANLITAISYHGNWHGNRCTEIRAVGKCQNSVFNEMSIPCDASCDNALFNVCFDAGKGGVKMSVRIVSGTYHEFDVEVLAIRKHDRSRWLRRDVHCSVSTQAVAVAISTVFVGIEIDDNVVFTGWQRDAKYAASSGFSARNRRDERRFGVHFNTCCCIFRQRYMPGKYTCIFG